MTIKELYDWAIEHNAENMKIGVQFEYAGGVYYGNTFEDLGCGITAEVCHSDYRNEDYVLIG